MTKEYKKRSKTIHNYLKYILAFLVAHLLKSDDSQVLSKYKANLHERGFLTNSPWCVSWKNLYGKHR